MKYIHESAPILRFIDRSVSGTELSRYFKTVSQADFGIGLEGSGHFEQDALEHYAGILETDIQELGLHDLPLDEIAKTLRGDWDLQRTQDNISRYKALHGKDLPNINATLIRNKLLLETEIETQEKLPELA